MLIYRIACLQGHKKICEFLIANNDDVNYIDPDGRSTLYCMILLKKDVSFEISS